MKKALAAILCAGFIYRILWLGKRQLWTDELIQALVARSSSFREIAIHLRNGVALPAPLDFLVQRCFVLLLGESSWVLRLHAAILATLSLWFFFRISRQLFGERIALYSTVLLTLYPLHYHYSQEAEPYSLVMLLTLISFDLLLKQLYGQGKRWKGWTFLALALALVLYASLLGILVVVTQFCCLIASAGTAAKYDGSGASTPEGESKPDLPSASLKLMAGYGFAAFAACLAFVPWLRYIWAGPTIPNPAPSLNWRSLLGMFREFGDNSPFVVVFLLAGVATGIRALTRHRRRQALHFLVVWSGMPFLGILILNIWLPGWYATHYLILAGLPLVLLAGYGLSYVGERMTIQDRLPYQVSSPAIAYAAILLLASAWIAQSHSKSEPVDWRGSAEFLQQAVRPGDALAMPKIHPLLEYYAPSLEEFRVDDLDTRGQEMGRRFVVCLDGMHPDPCASLRAIASKDLSWRRLQAPQGFTIYARQK